MNGRDLIRIDKWLKKIMNLDPILVFRESRCIKFGGRWEWWAGKISKASFFLVVVVIVFTANFKKSYPFQSWLELPHSCAQIETLD